MMIAGLGFSSRATASELVTAVQAAMDQHLLARDELASLASIESKRESEALRQAARQLGVGVEIVGSTVLEAVSSLVVSRSQKSIEATGLACVCEAAALAAASRIADGEASLLVHRMVSGPVTCALVQVGGGQTKES